MMARRWPRFFNSSCHKKWTAIWDPWGSKTKENRQKFKIFDFSCISALLQEGTRWPQLKLATLSPKMAPRWAKMAPGWRTMALDGSSCAQSIETHGAVFCPKSQQWPRDGPSKSQGCSGWHQGGPQRPKDATKPTDVHNIW